jgi:hypothetical protein
MFADWAQRSSLRSFPLMLAHSRGDALESIGGDGCQTGAGSVRGFVVSRCPLVARLRDALGIHRASTTIQPLMI